jgi:hypothetical protein
MAVTIAGDGTLLMLMIIFKGKHGGRIAQTEFALYPAAHHYHCQDTVWMDEQVMIALCHNGTQGHHPAPDFGQLPMPYDGIGSPQNSGVGH